MEMRSKPPAPDEPEATDLKTCLAEERTSLASQRVKLALERTTLAWIRTSLAMVSFGFGVIGFFRSLRQQVRTPESVQMHEAAIQLGYSLLILGVLATVLCAISHWRSLRRLERGEKPVVAKWSLSIALAVAIFLLGLSALWSLLA
jgi:putative membrane protein